jgi:hypothetical protein
MFGGLAAGVDLASLSVEELNAAMVELGTMTARFDAAAARLVGHWDARRCWRAEGARTASAWLRTKGRMAPATAARTVKVARAMRAMPATEAAWRRGEINADHVIQLIRSRACAAEEFDRDEEQLIEQARTLPFRSFEAASAYWRQLADEAGMSKKAAEQHGRRRLSLSQSLGGWWYGEFGLGPLDGATVDVTLRAIYDELLAADWAEARARLGPAATVADLARTPEQRRADALVEMAIRARTAPADGRRPAPRFTVLVGYETFAGRVCELANGTVVTPGALVPYLDQAYVERVVFDGPSRVIDVGTERRFFTGALRRAIEVRDRTCYHPLCDEPAEHGDIDHIDRYTDGGPTTQINGRPACPFHNQLRERSPEPPP